MGNDAGGFRLRRLQPLVLGLWLAAGCQSCGHKGGLAMNANLDAPAAQPRHVAIAARSWAGSPQSLVAAADDLLVGTGLFEEKGTSILWFEDKAAAGGYMVAGGYLFRTTASVRQLQGVLHAVEERLNDGQPPKIGGFLKTDLLWVEGTQVDTPDLKLPNPEILTTGWALNVFMAVAEDPFASGCGQGTENLGFCHAVDKRFKHAQVLQVYETPLGIWAGGQFKDGVFETWGHARGGNEETLTVSFDALVLAGFTRRVAQRTAPDDRHLFEDALVAVSEDRATDVFPIEVELPAGDQKRLVLAWLEHLDKTAQHLGVIAKRVVLHSLSATHAKGMLIGHKAEAASAPRAGQIARLEMEFGGGAPREPKGWSTRIFFSAPLARLP